MTLWKQRLFARLMAPADGEGSDSGGGSSVMQAAMDAIGSEPAAEQAPAEAAPTPEPTASPEPEPAQTEEAPKPGARMAAMLDELTDDPNKPKDEAKTATEAAKPKPKPEAEAAKTASPEQEEAELLEVVKSERGRERIKAVFAERKALETNINEFRDIVQSTGMSAQDFAQTLEFGRLVNSGDEKNMRVALEMIERQRAAIYERLGVEAPGVDLLADHADLKQAVENLEIPRDRAVELAKFRKLDAQNRAQQQASQAQAQDIQGHQQSIGQASVAMKEYLATREKEVDHPARMKVITDHFKDPAKLQQFVETYQPHQWAATIRMMYDNIQIPRAAAAPRPQPIRSRPAVLGTASTSALTPMDRLTQRMESMGL